MGRSFARATPAELTEAPDQLGAFHHARSDRTYRFLRRGGQFFLRRHQTGPDGTETNVVEVEIHYVVGSGNHSRTYLHRTAENRLVELPVSWYPANGGYLAMSPGYDRPDHYDFRRKISYDCFFCHNGYPRLPAGADQAGADPVFPDRLPEGIDCQRCHGPGRAHIEAAQQKREPAEIRQRILHPGRLPAGRRMEVCLQCHLETTTFPLPNALHRYGRGTFSYRPDEPLNAYLLHFDHAPGSGREDKFEIAGAGYRFRQSACFQKSGGKLTCTTCHNPHEAPRGEKAAAHYAAACGQCHAERIAARTAAGRHPQGADCAGCHMPKRRTEDVVHVAMTDHRIVRKPGRGLLDPREERHETAGVSYRGEVMLYYPEAVTPEADRDLYLAVAQVIQKSNLAAGIPRLAAAIERHQPPRPEFYFALAEAYLAAGDRTKALGFYQGALERDARFLPALRGMGSALLDAGDLPRATATLEQARALGGSDAPTLHELGRAYYQAGRRAEATAVLREAIRRDPDLPEIHDSLGNMLLESGDRAAAEQALREAIRLQPDFAAAHANLANALAAQGNFGAAEWHFRKAVGLAPANATARYGYGAVLAARGAFADAERQLEQTVKLNPRLPEAHEVLGSLYARRQDWRRAAERYRAAIDIQPRFGRAHLGLGMVLAASGDLAGARRHLSLAATDQHPAVRREAAEVLQSLPAAP